MTLNKFILRHIKNISYILFVLLIISCEKGHKVSDSGYMNLSFCSSDNNSPSELSVLSFNKLSSTSISSVSNVLEIVNPDIIGLQESYELGFQIADRFGYCFYGSESSSTSFLSKYYIEDINENYCKIHINDTLFINFFNIHLTAFPYQPYDIRDTLITTPNQAIHQAEQTRGGQVDKVLDDVKLIDNHMPIIIVGDFNEPSHLDWISGSINAQYFNYNNTEEFVVDWPTSNKFMEMNLIDVYRHIYPNPILFPGYTWTTLNNVNEVHDRIDFIYFKGKDIIDCHAVRLIGPDSESDIMIDNYQSDHRSVLATFKF